MKIVSGETHRLRNGSKFGVKGVHSIPRTGRLKIRARTCAVVCVVSRECISDIPGARSQLDLSAKALLYHTIFRYSPARFGWVRTAVTPALQTSSNIKMWRIALGEGPVGCALRIRFS